MGNRAKSGLLVFLFILLLLPMLQQQFPLFTSRKLDGFYTNAPDVHFSWKQWWEGSYQEAKTNYLNDHTGFRPELLRLNDQLDYSLFGQLHSLTIVEGKDHYLYQDVFINAWYGRDFSGYAPIADRMWKLRKVQDTLRRSGKTLVLVYAPCKAFFYPDYFPDKLKSPVRGTTNVQTYAHIGDSLGICQVDFNSWFMSMKNKQSDLLYSKQGFHWTVYGSLLAADSLSGFLGRQMHIQLSRPIWTKTERSTVARSTDDDIDRCLDILFPVARETYSYPVVSYATDSTIVKPNVIYIGDSYLLTWLYDDYMDHANAGWQLWYYNKLLWHKEIEDEEQQKDYLTDDERIKAIDKTDAIVIMYTSRNMRDPGNGFIEWAYAHYFPQK